MLHGIILAIENLWLSKIMKRWWVPFQHAYLLLIVMLSWVLFRTPTISDGIQYYIALAGLSSNPISYYDPRIHIDSTEAIILVFGVIASMPTAVSIRDLLQRKGYVVIGAVCDIAGAIIITVLSYCYIASSTFMPFLYQRF
jgi:alginate O-acetyltransferase complex protein AlgI